MTVHLTYEGCLETLIGMVGRDVRIIAGATSERPLAAVGLFGALHDPDVGEEGAVFPIGWDPRLHLHVEREHYRTAEVIVGGVRIRLGGMLVTVVLEDALQGVESRG